jgi:4-hydroxybenzoate polyprenyltransferase
MTLAPYFQLLRLHKPIGTLLLWFPTAWALWVANQGAPSFTLISYFLLGTFVMRAAGCILNDMADRHVDPHVKRTAKRPLAAKTVSFEAAILLFIALLFTAFAILTQLPKACFNYALISLALTAVYPFCKRFFEAPQLILGFAFSMGIPMAYVASAIPMNTSTLLLLLINFVWIIAYDTIYAMADREDDLKIGVRSTAILFAPHDNNIVLILHITMQLLWLLFAHALNLNTLFYIAWGISCMLLIHQQYVIRNTANPDYLRTFTNNAVYGLVLWVALIFQSY